MVEVEDSMPGVCGLNVVERAKAYAATHPHAPSLEVLDHAMQGSLNTHIAFEYEGGEPWDDWLNPPSPFATLLHRAFGMHLPDADVTAESDRWQIEVIEAFAERYKLWR
jgi:hypothetical protein